MEDGDVQESFMSLGGTCLGFLLGGPSVQEQNDGGSGSSSTTYSAVGCRVDLVHWTVPP